MLMFLVSPLKIVMRQAAMDRHEILVKFWYPAGPERDRQMLYHEGIVKAVYGF